VFVDPNATQVAVVGTFNQWRKDATLLEATGVPGVWAVSVSLEAGRHEYAFVVDGEKWSPDPFAPAITDEFGTESSIVRIGQAPASS
jgi:1,4-alpha-glucan branching enzyme